MKPNPALLAKQIERTTLARIKRQADAWRLTDEGRRAVGVSAEFEARWAAEAARLQAAYEDRRRVWADEIGRPLAPAGRGPGVGPGVGNEAVEEGR